MHYVTYRPNSIFSQMVYPIIPGLFMKMSIFELVILDATFILF